MTGSRSPRSTALRPPFGTVRRSALALLAVAGLLAACAPGTEEEGPSAQAGSQVVGPLQYVPIATGARWSYLPDGAQLSEPLVVTTVLGPTVLDGQVRTAWRTVGRGLDVRFFRQHGPEGTFLVREERPGTIIEFDPPIRELPGEPLRVGQSWSGETTATVTFPDADAEHRTQRLGLDWVSTVVDRRPVNVPAGPVEVFVLNFTSRSVDEEGNVVEELTQETWFSPYLGQVRTENGFYLVESNLIGLPRVGEQSADD